MSSLWAHADRRSYPIAIAAGLSRAIPATATTDPRGFTVGSQSERVRDVRALVMYAAMATYNASSPGAVTAPVRSYPALPASWQGLAEPLGESTAIVMTQPINLDAAHLSVVAGLRAINLGWLAVAQRNAKQAGRASLDLPFVYGFSTENEGAPTALGQSFKSAGALPVVGVVAVIAGAAALAYLGAYALDVVERNLARETDTRRLVALTAAATQVVAQHTDGDRAAGKSTPLTPPEQAVVDALISGTKTYTAAPSVPPIPPKPPIIGGDGGGLFAGAGTVVIGAIVVIGLLIASRSKS